MSPPWVPGPALGSSSSLIHHSDRERTGLLPTIGGSTVPALSSLTCGCCPQEDPACD